jgi:hypothetical protein
VLSAPCQLPPVGLVGSVVRHSVAAHVSSSTTVVTAANKSDRIDPSLLEFDVGCFCYATHSTASFASFGASCLRIKAHCGNPTRTIEQITAILYDYVSSRCSQVWVTLSRLVLSCTSFHPHRAVTQFRSHNSAVQSLVFHFKL